MACCFFCLLVRLFCFVYLFVFVILFALVFVNLLCFSLALFFYYCCCRFFLFFVFFSFLGDGGMEVEALFRKNTGVLRGCYTL